MRYRHLKTGNLYQLLSEGRDCTNARDGERVAIYHRDGDASQLFVRELTEFHQKFQAVE